MGMGGNGNCPHGNPMGMGISQKLGNGGGREWELNRWEWEGMGMLKAIPAHLYWLRHWLNCICTPSISSNRSRRIVLSQVSARCSSHAVTSAALRRTVTASWCTGQRLYKPSVVLVSTSNTWSTRRWFDTGHCTSWISLSLSPKFGLRPKISQKVKLFRLIS